MLKFGHTGLSVHFGMDQFIIMIVRILIEPVSIVESTNGRRYVYRYVYLVYSISCGVSSKTNNKQSSYEIAIVCT